MEDQEVKQILEKYISGMATKDERAYVESWYLKIIPSEAELLDAQLVTDQKESLDKLMLQIEPRKYKIWPKIAIAAAVATIVFTAGLFYYNNSYKKEMPNTSRAGNINPGSTGATLTLANGRKVKLNDVADGEIARQLSVSVRKNGAGQLVYQSDPSASADGGSTTMNTLTTANGQTYMLTLPDQSKVWMNAASSLTYSVALTDHGVRKVKLDGEAYFEIHKDKHHPFIVVTDKQEVKVLGTHFNVNSYADERITKTTLLEGSVQVSVLKSNLTSMLKPGEQAVLKNNSINVSTVEADEAVAWKNGYFQFNESNLSSIMRQISRWYNIDVVFEGKSPDDLFHVKIPRNLSLQEVLKIFEMNGINFKIEGRRLIVKS